MCLICDSDDEGKPTQTNSEKTESKSKITKLKNIQKPGNQKQCHSGQSSKSVCLINSDSD